MMSSRTTQKPHGFASANEVADYLGCHRNTVYNLTRDGALPSVKIKKLRRYRWTDVIAYGEGLETAELPPRRQPTS